VNLRVAVEDAARLRNAAGYSAEFDASEAKAPRMLDIGKQVAQNG
jgi:hypothetical protein